MNDVWCVCVLKILDARFQNVVYKDVINPF